MKNLIKVLQHFFKKEPFSQLHLDPTLSQIPLNIPLKQVSEKKICKLTHLAVSMWSRFLLGHRVISGWPIKHSLVCEERREDQYSFIQHDNLNTMTSPKFVFYLTCLLLGEIGEWCFYGSRVYLLMCAHSSYKCF